MGIYEGYKKLFKECLEDAKKLLTESFKKEVGYFNYEAMVILAIKLADVKVVAEELEE